MNRFLFFLIIGVFCSLDAGELDVVTPKVFYAVEGVPTRLNCRSFVLLHPAEAIEVEVDCEVGQLEGDVWNLFPGASDVGEYSCSVRVTQVASRITGAASFKVRVIPRHSQNRQPLSLMIVGDSLTNASRYPNTISQLLDQTGNPEWAMMGTHHPRSALSNVSHEGYGGWTWARFNNRYAPEESQTGKTRTSPFVFAGESGEAALDVGRYFAEYHEGNTPEIIFVLLGINDCFHADPDDPGAIEQKIDAMMREAGRLIAEFKRAAPAAKIGIGLTPAPNDREGAFVANYGKRYTRDGWRRIQFRLVERQIEVFSGRENEGVFVVPTAHSIHPHLGYPHDNAVHPNDQGYETIGRNVYAWIKAVLHDH